MFLVSRFLFSLFPVFLPVSLTAAENMAAVHVEIRDRAVTTGAAGQQMESFRHPRIPIRLSTLILSVLLYQTMPNDHGSVTISVDNIEYVGKF